MYENTSLGKYALTSGITVGAVAALVTLAGKMEALATVVGVIRFMVLIGMSMYFVRAFRDKYNGGFMTGSQAFSLTLLMFLYVGIIAGAYTFIQLKTTNPADFSLALETARATYEENGIDVSSIDWDAVLSMIPYMVAFMIWMGHIILGMMLGGVYALRFRKEAPYNDNTTGL